MKLYTSESYLELTKSFMNSLRKRATERTSLKPSDFPFILRYTINKMASLESKIVILKNVVEEVSVDKEVEKLIEDMKETLKPFNDEESINYLLVEMNKELSTLNTQYEYMLYKLRNTHVFNI